MFFSENLVRKAVQIVGGPTAASNALGVSNSCVHKWVKSRRVPSLTKATQLAELAGMTVTQLRSV